MKLGSHVAVAVAAAAAPIRPLAWEPPYAEGAVLEKTKKKKKKKKKKDERKLMVTKSDKGGRGVIN